MPPWKRARPDTPPAACLLAKPTLLNINLSSDRFAMFNKERDIGGGNLLTFMVSELNRAANQKIDDESE